MEINGVQRPNLPKGYLGPQQKFQPYCLSTLSHNNPEIELEDNELVIKIKAGQPTKVTANLINITTQAQYKDCIFHQTDDETISFTISVPETGFYKFQIYALPASEDSKTLYGVYNYLISCPCASKPVRAFPKQYASWKQGCYLFEPLYIGNDNLADVNFKVRIPGAMDVALTVEGQWIHLAQTEPAIWEGNLSIADYRGRDVKLALNANFGGDSSKFSTLLDYRL
ncbi:uncharacterized protein [Haliotis cracherodii]|uniref:uncharacterized protein n=1 Tax=Haliotis cracherodii TaxID=6455 RepID=UPI0039E762CA